MRVYIGCMYGSCIHPGDKSYDMHSLHMMHINQHVTYQTMPHTLYSNTKQLICNYIYTLRIHCVCVMYIHIHFIQWRWHTQKPTIHAMANVITSYSGKCHIHAMVTTIYTHYAYIAYVWCIYIYTSYSGDDIHRNP
jgi:hypothetical protein